jgi:hypothetical protein
MKKLFLIIFLLTAVIGFSQTDVYRQTFDGGATWGFYFTDIDSATTNIYYTEYFDISSVDNQTLYLMYDAVSSTGKHDDSLIVILQGRTPFGLADTAYIAYNLDTLLLKCAAADTSNFATMSLTAYSPWVRLRVTQYVGSSGVRNDNRNSLNVRLAGAIYAKLQDPMYMPRVPWR